MAIAGSRLDRVSHSVYFNKDILPGQTKSLQNKAVFCAGDADNYGRGDKEQFLHLPFNLLLPLDGHDRIT